MSHSAEVAEPLDAIGGPLSSADRLKNTAVGCVVHQTYPTSGQKVNSCLYVQDGTTFYPYTYPILSNFPPQKFPRLKWLFHTIRRTVKMSEQAKNTIGYLSNSWAYCFRLR